MKRYQLDHTVKTDGNKRRKFVLLGVAGLAVLVLGGWFIYRIVAPTNEEKAVSQLQFDQSVTEAEKQAISDAVAANPEALSNSVDVSVSTGLEAESTESVLAAYVPVTHVYSARQDITSSELGSVTTYVPEGTDEMVKNAIAASVGIDATTIKTIPEELNDTSVAFIPADQLSFEVKLLSLDNAYYLDSFKSGAIFRQAEFGGDDAEALAEISLNQLAGKDETLKVNMTGVTALTRLMMRKLASVGDATYFSEKIGDFMADADITHVSNEVSFREGCQYSNTSFCSPPEFIETLKDSGVDLVELTGNHNNDNGSAYNTESINLYHSLGMATFGGGLNRAEAAKPHVADQKGSKVTFIGYNMADGIGSGALAGDGTAGANYYTDEKAKADIEAAKQNSQFVIVNIQYAECQAYPSGYVEYPVCDSPIPGQEEDFKAIIDYGADMVIGSSAHQPQTYELYKGKPIYYGLGNLYFEQTQWPGTERGIIVTNYFVDGKLVQTKLTPTVYDKDYQTRPMTPEEAQYLLERLQTARG